MRIDDATNCGPGDVAYVLNVSVRRVNQMINEGLLTKNANKKYDLQQCVEAYINDKTHGANARGRLYNAQAEKAEVEAAEKRGLVAPVNGFVETLLSVFAIFGIGLDAIAGRLANELAGVDNPAVIRQRILDEMRGVRSNVVDRLREFVEDLQRRHASVTDTTTAAEEVPKPVGERKQNTPTRKRRARKV